MLRYQIAAVCSLLLATLVLAQLRRPSQEDLNEALQHGKEYVRHMNRIEELLEGNAQQNPVNAMMSRFKPADLKANAQAKETGAVHQARKFLRSKGLDDKVVFGGAELAENRQTSCDPGYPFRSFDGTCNNLNRPKFGQAGTIFQRIAPNSYKDGVSTPRVTSPSPRLVSTTVVINASISAPDATLMTMQWGQFLDHDLTLTATATTSTGGAISCCSSILIGGNLASPAHPECMPISIPSGDPAYGSTSCMSFVRSTFGNNLDGSVPVNREQINSNSHWIDASQIYGSSDTAAQSLRDTTAGKGLMKTSVQGGRTLLPLATTCCSDGTTTCTAGASCFVAGDARVTEQPLLTTMHTLWLREHNRIANQLAALVPGKSDDFYYQHTRRIVIGEWQHIIYKEYLPVLIGKDLADMIMAPTTVNYNPNANPAIFNEFAAAAYRMGHSQLRSFISLIQADGQTTSDSYFLSDSFLSGAKLLQSTFIDNALRGLTRTPVQAVDNSFANDVTSQLFKGLTGTSLGMDLVSLNIQRGRDHGLPPYIGLWRAAQGLPPDAPVSFDNLALTTPPEIVSKFKQVYANPIDIDLFIGGVTEIPRPGALVGPTFAFVIKRQFDNLKHADRFFYNDLSQPGSLGPAQLGEILKTSLARIICDNSDGTIANIQPKVFRSPGSLNNAPVPCSQIPGMYAPNLVPPPPRPPPPPPPSG